MVSGKPIDKFSALKNSKIKKYRKIKKELNTQVKLHFEKTNSKSKIFSRKSRLTAQRRLSRQL